MAELRESIVVESPYSVALDAIERRLRALKNRFNLTVPLRALGLPTPIAFEAAVDVEFKSLHGARGHRQLNDKMRLHWKPAPSAPYPHFSGEFEMRPLGLHTELELTGSYEPPFGAVGAAFDAVVGGRIAAATAKALLADLKAHLEADFATVRDTIEQSRRPE